MTNIEELKAKFPGVDIFTLTVKNRQEAPITIHLREMDRVTYKVVSSLIAKDELQGVESFLRTLCVDGDVNAIINDFKALRSAAATILPMLKTEEGELKKLESAKKLLETDEFARKNALIRFYYQKDPNAMNDDEWATSIEEIMWVLKFNGTIQEKK